MTAADIDNGLSAKYCVTAILTKPI